MFIKIIRKFAINFGINNKAWIKKIPIVGTMGKRIYQQMFGSEHSVQLDSSTFQKDYSGFSVHDVKKMMDERYSKKQAYQITYLWDQIRSHELNSKVSQLISPTDERVILEVGCGIGGSASYISKCQEFIGTDLSEIAVSEAIKTYGNKPNFKFVSMDAMDLKFKDNYFDIVIAQEVIEHLPEPARLVREAFRVLKPSGLLVITSPNRDSLHLRVNRMLGYPDFKCSFDHIKEFTFHEAEEMITKAGFNIKETRGVFLQPYWGIPEMNPHLRLLTDTNPEMVEILRDLGDLAGAKYSFCFIISALKPPIVGM